MRELFLMLIKSSCAFWWRTRLDSTMYSSSARISLLARINSGVTVLSMSSLPRRNSPASSASLTGISPSTTNRFLLAANLSDRARTCSVCGCSSRYSPQSSVILVIFFFTLSVCILMPWLCIALNTLFGSCCNAPNWCTRWSRINPTISPRIMTGLSRFS